LLLHLLIGKEYDGTPLLLHLLAGWQEYDGMHRSKKKKSKRSKKGKKTKGRRKWFTMDTLFLAMALLWAIYSVVVFVVHHQQYRREEKHLRGTVSPASRRVAVVQSPAAEKGDSAIYVSYKGVDAKKYGEALEAAEMAKAAEARAESSLKIMRTKLEAVTRLAEQQVTHAQDQTPHAPPLTGKLSIVAPDAASLPPTMAGTMQRAKELAVYNDIVTYKPVSSYSNTILSPVQLANNNPPTASLAGFANDPAVNVTKQCRKAIIFKKGTRKSKFTSCVVKCKFFLVSAHFVL
jgi:hypothetical protein